MVNELNGGFVYPILMVPVSVETTFSWYAAKFRFDFINLIIEIRKSTKIVWVIPFWTINGFRLSFDEAKITLLLNKDGEEISHRFIIAYHDQSKLVAELINLGRKLVWKD
jgi:hypothetical protein